MKEAKIRRRVTPLLPAGEVHVAAVQLFGGTIVRIGNMPLRFPYRIRVLAVTDQRVHLFAASWWRVCTPKRHLREIRFGELSPARKRSLEFETEIDIAGETHWTNYAWRKELTRVVDAANALLSR